MSRYVAFLRAMNVGGRRVKNDELSEIFRGLGFQEVSPFLASGNVVFDASDVADDLSARIVEGLQEALGYDVPTFLRTADEVLAIAQEDPFEESRGSEGGKLQVALLSQEPSRSARTAVMALATERNRLSIGARELYWLPQGRMSDSDLDLAVIEEALGPMTIRTKRTLDRIADRFLSE